MLMQWAFILLGHTFVDLFGRKGATVWVTRARYIIIVRRPQTESSHNKRK